MPAIHSPQRVVVNRFDAELKRYKCALRDCIDHADLVFVDTIGPRADGQADDVRMVNGIDVKLPEIFRLGVGVREWLKVDDELVGIESFSDVLDAFANLIADGGSLNRGWRTKRVVIAIGATADRNRAIAIRAREPRVHNHFVNALAEFFLEPAVIGSEAFLLA